MNLFLYNIEYFNECGTDFVFLLEQDFKHETGGGNRLEVIFNMISRSWIQEYFDGNPLSSLSILAMRDGLAERFDIGESSNVFLEMV